MTSKQDIEEINIHLDRLDRDFKEITKQFSSIQTSLDLIYSDRDLLEDIQNEITKVRELVLSADKHNVDLTKDVKRVVETKTDEVKFTVEEKTNEVRKKLIKRVPDEIVSYIQHMFKKLPTTRKLEKKSRLESVISLLKFWNKIPF